MKKQPLVLVLSAVLAFPLIHLPAYAEETASEEKTPEMRKTHLREKLQHLKETDPKAYQQAVARLRERRHERLEWLREHHPEEYRRLMAQRRENVEKRLSELKERNPQRYQELTEKRQQWRKDRVEQFKKNHPEKAERFLEKHPDWKERHDLGVRDHGRGEGREGVGRGGEHRRFDQDNNPPGSRGGRGTNWENRPGPRGGPGASPDRRGRPAPRRGGAGGR